MNKLFQKLNHSRILNKILLSVIYSPALFIPGCHCDPGIPIEPNGAIVLSVSASRTTGVAPLSVFFDATGTRGLGNTDYDFFSAKAGYMDATFAWDFDADNNDPDGNYEKASGFVAAHVFEDPGTYRVHLDVYDSLDETASEDITITVTEFSGTTYYVADGGSDSATGLTMSDPFSTPGRALSSSVLGPNVRVLFKNGDTFTISSMVSVSDVTGPVIIGAYSDPAVPPADKPVIFTTAVDSDWSTIHFWNCSDIRIMDIGVRATAESSENPRYPFGIGWGNDCVNMLKYRTEEYQNGGMSMSPYGRYTTIAECDFHHTTQTGFTSPGEGANDSNAIIGNWVHEKSMVDTENEEHVFRLQGGSRYFIAHNTFGPNIKVNYDALTIRGNSDRVVIYNNRITGWVQDITPQNRNSAEEYQHHCIMDSNLIMGQGLFENDRQIAIGIRAKDIVIRNNIIYNYQNGIGISDDTVVGESRRIKVYNNTFINPSPDAFRIIYADAPCYDIAIKNNLMLDDAVWDPIYTGFLDVRNGNNLNGESDNNIFYGSQWSADPELFCGSVLSVWQSSTGNDLNSLIADPMLINADDCNDPDFGRPQADSPVIDAGAFTPAALDFNGNLRDSSRDVGACEYY